MPEREIPAADTDTALLKADERMKGYKTVVLVMKFFQHLLQLASCCGCQLLNGFELVAKNGFKISTDNKIRFQGM